MHSGPHGGPRDFVIRSLKFTDEQVKEYDVLINEHRETMDRLRKEGRELRQQLFSGLKSDHPGLMNKDSVAGLIANTQRQIEVVTYDHFAKVRKICTDAQKAEFDKIIGDVIKKMNGGPSQPPPRGGEGDRQGPPPGDGDGERRGPPPPPEDGEGAPPPGGH